MRMEKGNNNTLSTQNSQKKLGDCYFFKCLLLWCCGLMLKKCKIIVEFEVELILLSFLKTFSLLQGFRDRVVKSWKNKRGKSLSRYKYNSKADTNWSIALQQLQTLLPKKEGVEDKPKIGNRDELQAKRGLQQNYDATEHVNQHKSTPSAYI